MPTPARIVDLNIPTVALVGRVNVGKSTLFNRIVEEERALVSSIPGTTRTRNMAIASWRGVEFRIVDTGGLTFSERVLLESDIIKQTELAIAEADIIVFVTDIQDGLLPQEKELARWLNKHYPHKPRLFVANKADTAVLSQRVHDPEWRALGLGVPFAVSATTGSHVGDVLDKIYTDLRKIKKNPKTLTDFDPIKVAIMGKPNVGKSSLFNKLIGEDRVVVSDMPHTTREPHDVLVEVENDPDEEPIERASDDETDEKPKKKSKKTSSTHLLFIDTAGIRRKSRVAGELEKKGIGKSIETIDRCDVVLLVIDATEPVSDQDQQLAGLLREHTKSVILVINKWDESDDNSDEFRNQIKDKMYGLFPHLSFAPIVFVSAKTGYRVHQIFPLIKQAYRGRTTTVPQAELNLFLQRATRHHRPSSGKGVRHPKLLGFKQVRTNPPMFELFIKSKTSVHVSYVHYLQNRLREEFEFFATPIIIRLTKSKRV